MDNSDVLIITKEGIQMLAHSLVLGGASKFLAEVLGANIRSNVIFIPARLQELECLLDLLYLGS